jgi:UDP-N-acetylmuramoyl-tripeptide--D-alanyl-D-alanine ligase
MRMQVSMHRNVTIINDAYNANPRSMTAALHTLQSLTCSGKKVAVLGDMFELGESSPSAHYDIGKLAADVPVAKLFLLGDYALNTSQGAQDVGMPATDIVIGESHQALARALRRETGPGDVILVKASRGMTMEKVLDHYMKLLEHRSE